MLMVVSFCVGVDLWVLYSFLLGVCVVFCL